MAGLHEKSDADVRGLVFSMVGLLLLIALSMAAMWAMFGYLARREAPGPPPSPMARERVVPPSPQLQVIPAGDLEHIRQAEAAVLNSYGWVDRQQGIVRIPIDRAVELVAERGLPARSREPAADGRQSPVGGQE